MNRDRLHHDMAFSWTNSKRCERSWIDHEETIQNTAPSVTLPPMGGLSILGVSENIRDLMDHADKADDLVIDEDVTMYRINASFDGTITLRNAVFSQKADPNDILFVLADLRTVWVTAKIDPAWPGTRRGPRHGRLLLSVARVGLRAERHQRSESAAFENGSAGNVASIPRAGNRVASGASARSDSSSSHRRGPVSRKNPAIRDCSSRCTRHGKLLGRFAPLGGPQDRVIPDRRREEGIYTG